MCSIRRNARSRSRSSSARGAVSRSAGQRRAAVVSSCSPGAGRRRRGRDSSAPESPRASPAAAPCRSSTHRSPLRQSCGVSEVPKHDLLALTIQLDVASRGQKREPGLDLHVKRTASTIDQCHEPSIEAELAVLLPDQIDHRQVRLVVGTAKAPPELLREHRCAVRRPEQQDRVHAWDVDTLAEDVDREDRAQLSDFEPAQRAYSLVLGRLTGEGDRVEPGRGEALGHVLRMLNRNAEAKRAHSVWLGR